MPFGAEWRPGAGVRFRLWAPAARQVELCLMEGGTPVLLPMERLPEGWFELLTDRAQPGSRYLYCIDGGLRVPDPASRFQPQDVHGPSEVIDPGAFAWEDGEWRGRPWEEAVIYELHVGTFTPAGDFDAVAGKLDHLCALGVTALELMPVGDFPGRRNWGYDGALPYAPDSVYGRPEALKALVQAAHARGLMVLLDVVYNHFGPEGNYLHHYAPQFFSRRHHTAWGAAINFDGPRSGQVREFFIHNALYWLEEFHFDGLRLDAVHAIADDSQPDLLEALAARVGAELNPACPRHLVLENDHNAARYLCRELPAGGCFEAQWNEDLHHCLHVLLSGQRDGYYADYAADPTARLGRCLAEGFAYQGEPSGYRGGRPRGEPSAHLPPSAFVSFLQNHDQVGNRALGERIALLTSAEAQRAALTLLLLAPFPPLLFMGQEWGCRQPFLFFCDFGGELGERVATGRRREFAAFAPFREPDARAGIPDPQAASSFLDCVLDWDVLEAPAHAPWLRLHRDALDIRQRLLGPRLAGLRPGTWERLGPRALFAGWRLGDGAALTLFANLSPHPLHDVALPDAPVMYSTHSAPGARPASRALPPWCVNWYLNPEAPVP